MLTGDRQPKLARSLPDFSSWPARRLGGGQVVSCLVNDPSGCTRALVFNSGMFCLHPDREKLIARTAPGAEAIAGDPRPTITPFEFQAHNNPGHLPQQSVHMDTQH